MAHSQRATYSFYSSSTLDLVAEYMIVQHYMHNTYTLSMGLMDLLDRMAFQALLPLGLLQFF